jgi:hypothetical protein
MRVGLMPRLPTLASVQPEVARQFVFVPVEVSVSSQMGRALNKLLMWVVSLSGRRRRLYRVRYVLQSASKRSRSVLCRADRVVRTTSQSLALRLTFTFPEIGTRLPCWYFRGSLSVWIAALLSSIFQNLSCVCWENVARRLHSSPFATDKLPALSNPLHSSPQFASSVRFNDVAHRP